MVDKSYEEGRRDGQIQAMEVMLNDHKGRLDNHGNRLRILERVVWAVFGVAILIEVMPGLKNLLGTGI